VSQASWLTITSGSSGTAAGNVAFSVAANPVTIPLTGTIQAGNGSATATFTVTEVGACTYSLSTSQIAIQPGGGTYTVSVNTPNGCVWSAVPNASWLAISTGASGTGPGSFTLTASPNTTHSDLNGTITVMTQTLTVILGDPTGTPGTGSVTISGFPDSEFINPCSPAKCFKTVYESGSVSVTINGQTYSTSYSGGSWTATQLASNLANSTNYPGSPITATVSGARINISGSVNGVATDFPLSTAYTFDTKNFSAPAATAIASGPALTGGTN